MMRCWAQEAIASWNQGRPLHSLIKSLEAKAIDKHKLVFPTDALINWTLQHGTCNTVQASALEALRRCLRASSKACWFRGMIKPLLDTTLAGLRQDCQVEPTFTWCSGNLQQMPDDSTKEVPPPSDKNDLALSVHPGLSGKKKY